MDCHFQEDHPDGGNPGNTGQSQDPADNNECYNGVEGNIADAVAGLAKKLGNRIIDATLLQHGISIPNLNLLGSNNTNMGILGSDLEPSLEVLGGGVEAGALRFTGLGAGVQGARKFLGLVGTPSIQMDHVFFQAGTNVNAYWNLFPVSRELNRLMGQANNWTLSTVSQLKGLLARVGLQAGLASAAGSAGTAGYTATDLLKKKRKGCN